MRKPWLPRLDRPLRASALAAACGSILPIGCAPTRPDPGADLAAAVAIGLSDAIVFRVEGMPIDEAPFAADHLSEAGAIQRAAMTDPGLHAALARVRIAMADADQARLWPNPMLEFVLQWGSGKPQMEIALAQDIIGMLQIPREASAADHRMRAAAADAVTVAIDLVAQVQREYAQAQSLEAVMPILAQRSAVVDKSIETAEGRFEAREGTLGELAALRAQRIELDIDAAEARRRLDESRIRLARLIGEPSSRADWSLDAWSAPDASAAEEGRWIEAALQRRPEVQSALWTLRALGDDEALVGFWPWDGANAGVQADGVDDWVVGPAINTPVPIFDTGQAQRARVTAEQIEARHLLTQAQRDVVEDVRLAHRSLRASLANYDRVTKDWLPIQERRRTLAEESYQTGRSDVSALYQAEQELQSAYARAVTIGLQVAFDRINLQRAAGGPGVAAAADPSPAADGAAPIGDRAP